MKFLLVLARLFALFRMCTLLCVGLVAGVTRILTLSPDYVGSPALSRSSHGPSTDQGYWTLGS